MKAIEAILPEFCSIAEFTVIGIVAENESNWRVMQFSFL